MLVLDANILLELIEERAHFGSVVKLIAEHKDELLWTSTLSVSHAFYVAEAHRADLQ